MATEQAELELKTPTVAEMVDHVCDDGSDYDDGWGGRSSGTFDRATGILTLAFARDGDTSPDLAEQYGYDRASTEYRFKLIPDITGDAGTGGAVFDIDESWGTTPEAVQ